MFDPRTGGDAFYDACVGAAVNVCWECKQLGRLVEAVRYDQCCDQGFCAEHYHHLPAYDKSNEHDWS